MLRKVGHKIYFILKLNNKFLINLWRENQRQIHAKKMRKIAKFAAHSFSHIAAISVAALCAAIFCQSRHAQNVAVQNWKNKQEAINYAQTTALCRVKMKSDNRGNGTEKRTKRS